MTQRDRLEKFGWVRVSYHKMGCVRVAKWKDPKTGEIFPQYAALNVLVSRNKLREAVQS